MFLILGSTTVDLLITGMEHLPVLGADEFAQDNLVFTSRPLRMTIGGNGANSAYVLGRLAAATPRTVRLASAVGADELGTLMRGWLNAAGVDTSTLPTREDAGTSTTTIAMDAAFHRASFHHAGAYAAFTAADLPPDWTDATRFLLLTSYPLLTGLRADYAAILAAARAAGITTVVDIGPAIGTPATVAELAPLAPYVDYLVTNEHELSVCCGTEKVPAALRRLDGAGFGTVLLKLGAAGTLVRQGTMQMRVPSLDVTAHSTVGAGDAFNAGLLMALAQGLDPVRAVRHANVTAALVVAAPRGVLDSPTWAQVQAAV